MNIIPPQINEQEALDDPKLPIELRKKYLTELDRTNRVLGVYKTVIKEFFSFLKTQAPKNKTLKILEIGSGSGGLAREILRAPPDHDFAIEYHIMDLDPEILSWVVANHASENLTIHKHESKDAHLKQFQDNEFDFIICVQVLHHIHPLATVADMFNDVRRVAKQGFWMADFERKFLNPLFFVVGNFAASTDPLLMEDGRKCLNRSYTLGEFQNAFGQQTHWVLRHKRFFWNPFLILMGHRN